MNTQLSDEGGGIRRSELNKLFNYMYSTAPRPPSPDAADTTPLVSIICWLIVPYDWLVNGRAVVYEYSYKQFP